MKTYKRNLQISFGASLAILIISSAASYISIRNMMESAKLVNHTSSVLLELNNIMAWLRDAEAAQRGYLLTQDEEFIAPYKEAVNNARQSFDMVDSMTADNPTQQEACVELKSLLEKRVYILQRVIDIKNQTKKIDNTEFRRGAEHMSALSRTVNMMKLREQLLLAKRAESLNTFSGYTLWLIVAGGII